MWNPVVNVLIPSRVSNKEIELAIVVSRQDNVPSQVSIRSLPISADRGDDEIGLYVVIRYKCRTIYELTIYENFNSKTLRRFRIMGIRHNYIVRHIFSTK